VSNVCGNPARRELGAGALSRNRLAICSALVPVKGVLPVNIS